MTTTQDTVSAKRFRGDPTDLEAAYFRWIQADSAAWASTDRAERILRHHLELAAERAPGTVSTKVYRPSDGGDLGAAIQIVNDDMPLLVDSVTSALSRLGADVAEVVHPVFDVVRDAAGQLREIAPRTGEDRGRVDGDSLAESWIHVQLAPSVPEEVLDRIEQALPQLLEDLRSVDEDTPAMVQALVSVAERLDRAAEWAADAEITESAELLRWLADGHFTVLGYSDFRLRRTAPTADAELALWPVPGTGLGVLRDGASADVQVPVLGPKRPVLRLANGSVDSLIPGAPDLYFVSVAEYATTDPGGAGASGDTVAQVRGEHVFVGTFTVTALHENILDIPVIARRVHQVIEWAGFELNSFSGQAMLEVMQTFPRAELFSTDARRLFETVSAVINLGLRRQIRLFLRQDARSGAVYCLVYMPNDRYSSQVRLRMQDILLNEFGGERIGYSARVTESELAVAYFTVYRGAGASPADLSEANRERIQEILFATTRTWADRLIAAAAGDSGISRTVATDYASAFPVSYQQEFEPERALAELRRLDALAEGDIDTSVYRNAGSPPGEWRFTLYVAGAGVSLSRVLPVLHSLGVEMVDERPYQLVLPDGRQRWIYDFALRVPPALLRNALDPELEANLDSGADAEHGVAARFSAAVSSMWFGDAEVDGLNELVLRAGLNWRQVVVLRAYAKYLQQARFAYTKDSIARVLLANPMMARGFTELFEAYFDPERVNSDSAEPAADISRRLEAEIDAVVSLDADRILRAFLALISATLRTNHFRRDAAGTAPRCLSLKFDPQRIDLLPQPRPRFEIFVYSPRVEGVHLRFGAVARGGLRWSDRLEDFR
ncbi:NAD-glutamate dehydrogenase domain-containing protein, partial [Nocardia donostiensis]